MAKRKPTDDVTEAEELASGDEPAVAEAEAEGDAVDFGGDADSADGVSPEEAAESMRPFVESLSNKYPDDERFFKRLRKRFSKQEITAQKIGNAVLIPDLSLEITRGSEGVKIRVVDSSYVSDHPRHSNVGPRDNTPLSAMRRTFLRRRDTSTFLENLQEILDLRGITEAQFKAPQSVFQFSVPQLMELNDDPKEAADIMLNRMHELDLPDPRNFQVTASGTAISLGPLPPPPPVQLVTNKTSPVVQDAAE